MINMVNTWNGVTCEMCDRKRCTVCTFDDMRIELRLKKKTVWFVEKQSEIDEKWYPICYFFLERDAINEWRRLGKMYGDHYRVVRVVTNSFD